MLLAKKDTFSPSNLVEIFLLFKISDSLIENFNVPVSKALLICKSFVMLLSSSLEIIGVIVRLPSGLKA